MAEESTKEQAQEFINKLREHLDSIEDPKKKEAFIPHWLLGG